MNDFNDQELSAYLDQELTPARRAELEQALSQNAALQQRLQQLRAGNELARQYFATLDQQPLPQGLENLIRTATPQPDNVVMLPVRRRQPWLWATAASLLLATGLWWQQQGAVGQAVNAGLAEVLDTQASGTVVALSPELRLEVLASYQRADGSVCRQLLQHTPQASTPLSACYHKQQWVVQQQNPDGLYQTASGPQTLSGQMSAGQEQQWLQQHRPGRLPQPDQ